MITPAYAPTATERVLPRMALDFTTGVLDPRVTVTRALNTATRVNSGGLIELVNADLPRFDYDPATLAPRGLLIEETRANLLKYSEQFNDASWTKANTTVAPDAAISPDGSQNADRITSNAANAYVYQTFSSTAGVTYTFSVYVKTVTANTALSLRLFTSSGASEVAATTFTTTGNWQRVSVTGTYAATQSGCWAAIGGGGTFSTNETIYVWGAQLEAGAFATSYIPTTTTSLTRNADVVSMTGTNFSDWYNASQGAFVVDFDTVMLFPASTASTQVLSVSDGTNNNRMTIFCYADLVGGQVRQGGTTQAELYFSSIPSGVNEAFLAYKTNDVAATLNGAVAQVDTSATIPTVDRMGIGIAPSSAYLNGHVRSVRYFIQRLTNAEGRANTK